MSRSAVIAVPSMAAPRLLLPRRAPRAAAAAVAAFGAHLSGRPGRLVHAGAVVTGLGAAVLMPSASVRWTQRFAYLEERVREATARDDVVIAVRLAPDRPNGKPVAHILTPDGRTVAFAKVGWNPQGRRLVLQEADTLRLLAASKVLSRVRVPAVLATTDADGTALLLLEDVQAPHVHHDLDDLVPILEEVAAAAAEQSEMPLGEAPAWQDLHARTHAIAQHDDSPIVAALLEGAEHIVTHHGDRSVRIGRAHGDFIPANVGAAADAFAVWDWERSRTGAPFGLDAVHHAFATSAAGDVAERAARCLRRARPFGRLAGIDEPTLRALLMVDLLDCALRYREGRVDGTTAVDTVLWRALAVLCRGEERG